METILNAIKQRETIKYIVLHVARLKSKSPENVFLA